MSHKLLCPFLCPPETTCAQIVPTVIELPQVEAHDLALARPVLEMDPAASLETGCQSPCQSPHNGVLIWDIGIQPPLAKFVKFQAAFFTCELLEICSPVCPEMRASYRIFSNLDGYWTQYN